METYETIAGKLTQIAENVQKVYNSGYEKGKSNNSDIPEGYIKPEGTKEITENGTHDVTEFASVDVNVAGSGDGDIGAEKYFEGGYAEVVLPNVTSIKAYGFYQDTKVTNISMPKVTSIGASAFYGCTNLALTSLPSGVTSIGSSAFSSCTGLTSITFKGKPTSIASNAFKGCTNLTTINVPWAEGEVANAPWGATNATINYNYTGE
jgi:hypothetical protein